MSVDGNGASREEFWWLLVQVGHLSRRVAERWLAPAGAAPDQVQALRIIGDHAQITVGDLARAMGLERNSASQLVERLVKDGLAGRERSTSDRRQVFVALTVEGTALLASTSPDAAALANDLLSGVPASDLATAVRLLTTIRERATVALQRPLRQPQPVLAGSDGHTPVR
jgi:DNA-binding MarR family transcriptional regulator